jgi:hypothetical protein
VHALKQPVIVTAEECVAVEPHSLVSCASSCGLFGACYLELPCPPAHGAALLCLRSQPLLDALQVEGVATRAPDYWTIVTRVFRVWRAAIKRISADATQVVSSIPSPHSNGMPALYLDLKRHNVDDYAELCNKKAR